MLMDTSIRLRKNLRPYQNLTDAYLAAGKKLDNIQ